MTDRQAHACTALLLACMGPAVAHGQSLVNWESPHVNPIDLTPDGSQLLAVNTADNRVEVFDVVGTTLVHVGAIRVGLDPVSVRARTNDEAWVVNHVSDSISIVDINTLHVTRTISTGDEPADVVFAGSPQRAFVSISQQNQVWVYDAAAPGARVVVGIEGEDPRALATDGVHVYAAIFESGNGTTVLNACEVGPQPPFNAVGGYDPPLRDTGPDPLPPPPQVGHIVRQAFAGGPFYDDTPDSQPMVLDWDFHGHDLAVIDAGSLAVSYVNDLMNLNMHVSVAADGRVAVVGTDAINEIRFEPNLKSIFVRTTGAVVTGGGVLVSDLNELDYTSQDPLPDNTSSLGDPRGSVWVGTALWVTGMGSNNVKILETPPAPSSSVIPVGEGPTGIVLDAMGVFAYVLNRFEATVSVLDTIGEVELGRVGFYDPTPAVIKVGRKHLFDTHHSSALGQASCASCHPHGRMDQLAWDLGDPQGIFELPEPEFECFPPQVPNQCDGFHPMKGPMTTQTLQNIIHENDGNSINPLHWRGDKKSLSLQEPSFNGAFVNLLGRASLLTPAEAQELHDYVATITFPPNPNRRPNGALRDSLYLADVDAYGDPQNGETLFDVTAPDCIACHVMPTGSDNVLFPPIQQAMAVCIFQTTETAPLRNMYEKTGFSRASDDNNRGFGYIHDGSVANLFDFLSEPVIGALTDQEKFDLQAFMFSIGTDTHAAVGMQVTILGDGNIVTRNARNQLLAYVDAGLPVAVVATGRPGPFVRGYVYLGNGVFQTDRAGITTTVNRMDNRARPNHEFTYTIVPPGTEVRIGVDRDEDGVYDRDELLNGTDPADPTDF